MANLSQIFAVASVWRKKLFFSGIDISSPISKFSLCNALITPEDQKVSELRKGLVEMIHHWILHHFI
jgi:hypothetical protein